MLQPPAPPMRQQPRGKHAVGSPPTWPDRMRIERAGALHLYEHGKPLVVVSVLFHRGRGQGQGARKWRWRVVEAEA